MRPDTPTPGHRGIPSTEGYSRDSVGVYEWCADVSNQAHRQRETIVKAIRLTRLQRLALRVFDLYPYLQQREDIAHAAGRLYVANTAGGIFLSATTDD